MGHGAALLLLVLLLPMFCCHHPTFYGLLPTQRSMHACQTPVSSLAVLQASAFATMYKRLFLSTLLSQRHLRCDISGTFAMAYHEM
jgi:hypothetical protein